MDDILLAGVKDGIGITTDDPDVNRTIMLKVKAVKLYLIKGGYKIQPGAEYDEEFISCVAVGVNDLLNNKAGDTKFSPAFNMLAMQLCRG